jgi:hypothetical protein
VRLGIGAAALVVGAAACTNGAATAHTLKGPGGIDYQWPPPATALAGPPSTAKFCGLLIDDYEHLKTSQQTHGTTGEERILDDYVAFATTLEKAAPASISPAVARYVGAVADLLRDLAAHGLNVLALPASDLSPLKSPPVEAAATSLIAFSTRQCHYDLQANSTPTAART